jgi:hypothetical protein
MILERVETKGIKDGDEDAHTEAAERGHARDDQASRRQHIESISTCRLEYATIAHELAHAYRHAAGIHSNAATLSRHPDEAESMKRFNDLLQPSRVLPRGYTVGDEEEEAGAEGLVAEWGFRPPKLN